MESIIPFWVVSLCFSESCVVFVSSETRQTLLLAEGTYIPEQWEWSAGASRPALPVSLCRVGYDPQLSASAPSSPSLCLSVSLIRMPMCLTCVSLFVSHSFFYFFASPHPSFERKEHELLIIQQCFCLNKGALVLAFPCLYLHHSFLRTPSWEKLQKATCYIFFCTDTNVFLHVEFFSQVSFEAISCVIIVCTRRS